MGTMLATAVRYVTLNRWSVIPLKPNSKEPLIPWKEYQTRFPTMEELQTWFRKDAALPQNGIGIVTGVISNLSVVDVDSVAIPKGLFSPIGVRTPKGSHSYFKHQEGLGNAVRILPDVDIRSEGGFVVCPPTPGYRWVHDNFSVVRLPQFPIHVIPRKEESRENKSETWMSELLQGLSEGNRNDTFTKIVGRFHYNRFAANDILEILSPHAVRTGFDLGELRNVIESVTKKYQNNGQRESNVIYAENDTEEDFESFLAKEEKVEWIVPNVLAKSSIAFFAGLPETFKTWILAELAIEGARKNGLWLGKLPVKQVKTLFIDQERHSSETRRRFKKMLTEKGLTSKDVSEHLVVKTGSSIKLNHDESFNAFRKRLDIIKPELVIVDSFATFHTSAENDRQEIQKVLERVKQLRQEYGCTFIFIDHEGKSVLNAETAKDAPDAFKMVGSVGKPAAAETVFTIRKQDDNTVIMHHTKSTICPRINPVVVNIIDTENDGIKVVAQ